MKRTKDTPPRASGPTRTAPKLLRAFREDERGAILPFSIIIFMLMLMVGGLAIDLMRRETTRVVLQSTTDRAVLAAADLDQVRDARSVVEDYFEAAGLSDYLIDVEVDEGMNYREVTVNTSATIPTMFMNMMGVKTLTTPATSTAEERIGNVEISMVVDISGSMGWNSRLTNLKAAARDFVDIVSAQNSASSSGSGSEDYEITSVSIVPYQAMVNIGSDLASAFTLSNAHTYSNCVVFPQSAFSQTAVSPSTTIERMAHFDPWNVGDVFEEPNCATDDSDAILAYSADLDDLRARINSLSAGGNTATDMGVKWGVALLDPAARPAVNALVASGDLDARMANRPADFNDGDTLKVLVVMTDGSNTTQIDLKPEFKTGMSPVWYYAKGNRWSVWVPSKGKYYWLKKGKWDDKPEGDEEAVNLSMAELFAMYPVRYIAEEFMKDADSTMYNQYRNAVTAFASYSKADNQMLASCTAAKNQGIVVYAIGFEAPTSARNLLRSCASSDSHYFDAEGVEISEAFTAIARSIQKLKLTN